MNKLFEFLSRLCGLTGGLLLIALIIMWFGAIPLVAFIFGSISFLGYITMQTLMVILIVIVGILMMK